MKKVSKYKLNLIVLAATLSFLTVGLVFLTPKTTVAQTMTMTMTPESMPMVEATSVDSFTPKVVALSTSNWTVSASDQDASYPVTNVLDGNSTTFWHSHYKPTTVQLPHSLTIDMHATQNVSGLTYLPRQDTSANGTIGQYAITVSNDGITWSSPVAIGTWNDDKTLKNAAFPAIQTRFVRLTALTEAGNRGPFTSAAEITLLSTPPADPELPRQGWSATASDQNSTNPANFVLDGSATSIWHSYFKTPATPLPHSITIDMHSSKPITGLRYLPRQDSYSNGNIGKYSISVSLDGTNWGQAVATGTWVDDKTAKTVTFTKVSARYIRLTGLTEAGNRGPFTSAAEINLLSPGPSAAAGGKWDAPIGLPLVPVSAVVLPNNKLLTFAGYDVTTYNTTKTVTKVAIIDLATNQVSQPSTVDTNHQMFCVGLAILADGKVLINGGSSDSATTIYDPNTNTWSQGPLMNIPRGYQGDTLLSTGQVFTIGGSWSGGKGNKDAELYTPSATSSGEWSRLPNVTSTNILTNDPAGIYRADNHAWLFAVANGGVFHAGPSKQMNWITTASSSGSITSAGIRGDSLDAMNGNAAMYDINKIVTLGGAIAYNDVGTVTNVQATTHAYVIDISSGQGNPVTTTKVGDMSYQRAFSNSVVLPDGEVLVVGGQQHPAPFTDTGAIFSPELWNPSNGQFSIMAADATPRTYHSVALLLPDGKVFSGGGGLCGTCTVNHPDGRIFTPPYLINSNGSPKTRPVITQAPTTASAGATITIQTNSATPNFSLVRASAATHSVNNDQRRIPIVPVSTNGTTYTLSIPSDTGVVLPGPYMLFALDANGTPSVAKFILIN